MLRSRITPCLLLQDNGLVKTTQFKDPKYVGDPINAVKILNKKVGDYKKNKIVNKNLNISLSKSFFNDFSNFYIENLATKHKLIRNYREIEKFLLDSEPIS